MHTLHTFFALVVLACFLNACGNDTSTANTNNGDTTSVIQKDEPDSSSQAYNPKLDGMLVSPELTRKLGDTLGIKMYEVTVKPGDTIPLHSHPDHAFYVVEGGKAAIYFDGTNRQEWDLKPGMGFVNPPVTDAAKNIGKTTIKFLTVDIYRPRNR
jgi:quercetin dioxygenase-like cupin family protein